mgnify:CR=1 FL=1
MSDCQSRVGRDDRACRGRKVELTWGDTSKNLPWSCVSGGSQTTHAHDARRARGGDRCHQEAAGDRGEAHRRQPADRLRGRERARRRARAAAARHDARAGRAEGDRARRRCSTATSCRRTSTRSRSASATALAGQGLDGRRARQLPARRRRRSRSSPASPKSRSIVETGKYSHPRLPGGRRRRHGDPSARARRTGARPIDARHRPRDRPAVGLRPALRRAAGASASTTTSRRRFSTRRRRWRGTRSNIPDPETPVGARGIGEPPVAAGCCAVLNALSDALGDDDLPARPGHADEILIALKRGRPMKRALTAARLMHD